MGGRSCGSCRWIIFAHMLRHTVATMLLFNGCPIGHIKDILGHDRLITTCNFYLGADKRAAKKAHQDFLDYERGVSVFLKRYALTPEPLP